VHVDQLIAAPLSADGIFSPCANYIGIFNDVGNQLGRALVDPSIEYS
jgi:hypothetical protein